MHQGSHVVTWRSEEFRFERLKDRSDRAHPGVWAVSRRLEFIGTMASTERETTKEFEVRCLGWLAALLG